MSSSSTPPAAPKDINLFAVPSELHTLGLSLDNPQHERFVWEYFRDYSGSAAAVRAGYAPESARAAACALMQRADVSEAMDKLREILVRVCKIDAFMVLRELALIAFSDVTVYEVDPKTGRVGVAVGSGEPEATRALSSVKVKRRFVVMKAQEKAGERPQVPEIADEVEVDIKVHPKLKALELLAQHLKICGKNADQQQGDQQAPGVLVLRGVDVGLAMGLIGQQQQEPPDEQQQQQQKP